MAENYDTVTETQTLHNNNEREERACPAMMDIDEN